MQIACWQFCFSDRFTGARNPARLPTSIQSRRIRCAPLSISIIPCPATAIDLLGPIRRSQELKINFMPYLQGFYVIFPFNASNPPISCASVKLRRGLSHRKPPDGKLLASNHRQFRCYCPPWLEGGAVKQQFRGRVSWLMQHDRPRFETLRSVPLRGGPGDDDF